MSFWKPFFAGALASASTILLLHRYNNTIRRSFTRDSSTSSSSHDNKTEKHKTLMDSPHLDMRMIRKAEGAIQKRTSRLTLVIERCTNDHNYSAILRTAEALGVQNVYIISPPAIREINDEADDENIITTMKGTKIKQMKDEVEGRKLHHLYAQRATEWLTVKEFDNTRECLDYLRKTGHSIWATDLSQVAKCLSHDELPLDETSGSVIPPKLAIVFGTEAVGCTAEMLSGCDLRVYLPLRGFADSLNLSVATALVIHHLFLLDPSIEGDMSHEERIILRKLWFSKLAGKRLLTSRQKKDRTRLKSSIEQCRDIAKKKSLSLSTLTMEQITKLDALPSLEKELADLEQLIQSKAEEAVSDFIYNPPDPITDLRRPDEHRVAHVSKNTRARNIQLWEGDNNNNNNMPATASYHTNDNPSTSDFFRNRIVENNVTRVISEEENIINAKVLPS